MLDSVAERLRELLAQRPSRETFGAKGIELLQQFASVRAAALLEYDRQHGHLVLLAARGLPPHASHVLNARTGGWDIPLRCLRNRRISIVESAHRNPFVPRSLVAIAPTALTIAAIPGYADGQPATVALLFAAQASAFPDPEVRQLAAAVAAIAAGLHDPRLPAGKSAEPGAELQPGRTLPELAPDREELRRQLQAREEELGEAHRWVAALAERLRLSETEGENRLARAERDRDNWKSRAASLENQLREKKRELQELATEHARTLDAARQSATRLAEARERLARLETQSAELAGQKQAAESTLHQEQRERAAVEAKLRSVLDELAEVRRGAESARRENEELERALAAAQREVNALRRALGEREAALAVAEARLAELEASLRDAHRQREDAEKALAGILASEHAAGGEKAVLTIERTAPSTESAERERPGAAAVRPRPRTADSSIPALLVLDDPPLQHEAAAVLEESGWAFVEATPAEVEAAQPVAVGAVLLNVAASQGWQALWALCQRPARACPPIMAYALSPDRPAGFSFGRCEFGAWPPTPADLALRLERLQPGIRRLLVVSADVDEAGQLRDALARQEISASVALDGRQACDLTGVVRPEAVVVHLSPTCSDVGRVVSFLRSAPSRPIPLVVLLDDPAVEAVQRFLLGLDRSLQRLGNFDFGRLLGELTPVLRSTCPGISPSRRFQPPAA